MIARSKFYLHFIGSLAARPKMFRSILLIIPIFAILLLPFQSRAQTYQCKIISNVRYGDLPANIGDIYMPLTTDTSLRFPGIISLPEGGWVSETRNNYKNQDPATELAKAGFVSFITDYTCRSGKYAYPIWDNKAAVRFMRKNAKTYQIDPNHIGSMGFSAGGWSSYVLGFTNASDTINGTDTLGKPMKIPMEPSWRPYPEYSSQVQAIAPVSGFGGGFPFGDINITNLMKKKSPAQLPACLLMEGGASSDKVYDSAFAIELRKVGADVQTFFPAGLGHAFPLRPNPWGGPPYEYNYIPMVIDFFTRTLKAGTTATQCLDAKTPSELVRASLSHGRMRVSVTAHGAHTISILDAQGRIIAEFHGTGAREYSLDSRSVKAGTYVVRIRAANTVAGVSAMLPWQIVVARE
jgi:hypothetical protein